MTEALDHFEALMRLPADAIPLDAACAAIGAHLDPAPGALEVPARLDELASDVPAASIDGLTGHLFGTLGLRGDAETYDDPANSFLHRVLQRRLGLPIALSVLTVEVGQRLGLDLAGVGMPGHFIVVERSTGRLLDPFAGGRTITRDDCVAQFRRLFGESAAFSDAFLAPTPPLDILARVLANLRTTYARRNQRRPLAEVLRLRSLLPRQQPAEERELGGALEAIGAFDEAADAFERAATVADDTDRVRLEARAHRLRARLN